MRLQKFLAEAGLGARRKCEQYIIDGRVKVNGEIAQIGQNVEPRDKVLLDGKPLAQKTHVYIALNKPEGYASDKAYAGNRTIFDLVKSTEQLHAVGRLDMDSTGLVLLTNDGDLSFKLTHPRFEHEKEYRVRVRGTPTEDTLRRWRAGVMLDGEETRTLPCYVSIIHKLPDATDLKVILREGRKRQIRRVASLLKHPVLELTRMRIGPLLLGRLEAGRFRNLTSAEVESLRRYARD